MIILFFHPSPCLLLACKTEVRSVTRLRLAHGQLLLAESNSFPMAMTKKIYNSLSEDQFYAEFGEFCMQNFRRFPAKLFEFVPPRNLHTSKMLTKIQLFYSFSFKKTYQKTLQMNQSLSGHLFMQFGHNFNGQKKIQNFCSNIFSYPCCCFCQTFSKSPTSELPGGFSGVFVAYISNLRPKSAKKFKNIPKILNRKCYFGDL